MPRQARRKSKNGIYHIMLRGINKQVIFEDDEDYKRFLETVKKYKTICGYSVYAYCLMNNHIHLLIKVGHEDLDLILKRIAGSYVYWYNWKYARTGHLFQDRFKSEPVDSDDYLLTVLRYIHQNPVKAHLCDKLEDYKYSSYRDYIYSSYDLIDKDFIYSVLGSTDFIKFNNEANDEKCLELNETAHRLTDKEGQDVIQNILNGRKIEELTTKQEKEAFIKQLKTNGFSIRQISRLTGITVGIVRKC
ncbi:MAG: transposase [Clostridia bacterium]|nr:transposase [Clostridia bacterium]